VSAMPRTHGRRAARGPRLDPDRVAVAYCGDEAVLLDLTTYATTAANRTAALVLGAADGSRDEAGLARTLAAACGLPRRRARADVRRLLGALRRRGALARGPG